MMMLSRDNKNNRFNQATSRQPRFALRKLSVGVASVVIGLTFMGFTNASADETNTASGTEVTSSQTTSQTEDQNSSSSIDGQQNSTVPATTVASNTENTAATNQATVSVKVIDDDLDGKVLETTDVDKNSDINSNINDLTKTYLQNGYKLANNSDNYLFNQDENLYEVHLKHIIWENSGRDEKAFDGFVYFKDKDGHALKDKDGHVLPKLSVEGVWFWRPYGYDAVTKEHVNQKWETDKSSFDEIKVPEISGYTPETDVLNYVVLDPDTPNTHFDLTITYTPNPQSIHVNYVDSATGKTIKSDLVSGVTNGVAKLSYQVPDGYTVTNPEAMVKLYTFKATDNQDIQINLTKNTTPDPVTPEPSVPTPESDTPTTPVDDDTPTSTPALTPANTVETPTVSEKAVQKPTVANHNDQKLPQTGNTQTNTEALVGLGLMGIVAGMLGFASKRH